MLELSGISTGYGRVTVLHGVSFTANAGEITCVMGRNGAGKTTSMKAVMGHLPLSSGEILLDGAPINTLPAFEIPRRRIGYVPQGRRLFSALSVSENLEIGLMTCNEGRETRRSVLNLFPRLEERLHQRAETLSGGEQQMLAIARALCLKPRVLLLDEPTEGLQPSMIDAIRQVVTYLRSEGVAVVLVEQRIDAVLSLADQVCVLENGRTAELFSASDLKSAPGKIAAYLGV